MTAKRFSRVAIWATRLVLFAVLGLIAFAFTVLVVLPRATHGAALSVLTGSMTPTIPVGSVVVDRPVDPGTLHVGDIATYQKPGTSEFITHRIVKIDTSKTPTVFTFKGDANRGPDIIPVPSKYIRGKVWFHVPHLGAIRDALHTKGGLAGAAMLVLAGYACYQGASALRDRNAPKPATPAYDKLYSDPCTDQQASAKELPDEPTLIHAVVPRQSLDGLTPRVFGLLLGGMVIDDAGDEITILVATSATRLAVTTEILLKFDATRIEVSGNVSEDGTAAVGRARVLEAGPQDMLKRAPAVLEPTDA